MKLVPVFWVAALPAASLTSTAMVYDVPLVSPCRSDAATVTVQLLDDTEHVSVTLLIVVVTVWPSSAPDVVMVTVPAELSSAALRCVPQAADTADIDGCVLSIVMAEPPVRAVTADATALPAESEKVQENPTVPSWSALSTVTLAVWWSVPPTVA